VGSRAGLDSTVFVKLKGLQRLHCYGLFEGVIRALVRRDWGQPRTPQSGNSVFWPRFESVTSRKQM